MIRRLWSEGQHILGIPADETPDLNSCLFSRKNRRAIVKESLDSVLKQANIQIW
ncbi:putative Rab3 GTPase-activating protein catalytic subunit [Helianthus anomalus]